MLLTAPIGYVVKVLISNTLSVEDVGIFYSVFGLVMLFCSYHDLGLTEALQYYLPKYWIHKEYDNYKTILYVTLFAQILTGTLIAL
jgi:O-antigen/teichoic acid export membrane protein